MDRIYTDSQKKAHDLQRHLSVTANAGSGKTTVLVQRYVDILTRTDVQIGEVVAITFTERAASELKRRVAETIGHRLRTSSDPPERERLERIRDKLSFAVIGTIHSFCARILREHPVEAGVDPAFGVIEEVDQGSLIEESIFEVLQLQLVGGRSEHRDRTMDLLRACGKYQLTRILRFLIAKREIVAGLRRADGVYSRDDEAVLRYWELLLGRQVRELLERVDFVGAASLLAERSGGKAAARIADLLRNLERASDVLSLAHAIEEIADVFFTQKDEQRKAVRKGEPDDLPARSAAAAVIELRRAVRGLISCENSEALNDRQRRLLHATRSLFLIHDQVLDRYNARKREQGVLDFEDLLILTNDLLSRWEAADLTARYKFLMVDEYQDTNRLQFEILRKLVAGFRKGNLFIVGDPKQSIYGFRNAEVEVFDQTKEEILGLGQSESPFTWNGVRLEAGPREMRGDVTLADSFRLLRDPVAFVNVVFGKTMITGGRPFEVTYDPLVMARANAAAGRVELLLITEGASRSDGGKAGSVEIECRALVARIRELVWERYSIFESGTEVPRPVRYGDIAILLRTRTNLPVLERVLVEAGVPYLITGGIGFYQTQEIYDLFNYLQFLLSRQNDTALAGILRSPFFALSDAELFEISLRGPHHGRPQTFWEKLDAYVREPHASPQARRAHAILGDHLRIAQRLTPAALLLRVLDDTSWWGTIAGTEWGEQNAANVEKLLSLARRFTERGFVGLFDLVERFRALIETEEDEGQANVDTAGTAVQLLTIHAAKGLEFPVVLIPFAHRLFRYDQEPFLDPLVGLGLSLSDPLNPTEKLPNAITESLRTQSRYKTDAEEKRIFYVACTRARDLLILSGDDAAVTSRPSYLRWVYDAFGIERAGGRETLAVHIRTECLAHRDGAFRQYTVDHELLMHVLADYDRKFTSKVDEDSFPVQEQEWRIADQPLAGELHGEVFSASQIQTYSLCASKYHLIYRLGLREHEEAARLSQGEADINGDDVDVPLTGEVDPTVRGTIVHRALQRMHAGMSASEIKSLVRSNAVGFPGLEAEERTRLQAECAGLLSRLAASPSASIIFGGVDFRTEHTISAVFGRHVLTGIVDRLVRGGNGRWEVIDFKTDAVTEESVAAAARRYRPQMQFYAYLVHRLYPGQEEVSATLVFLNVVDRPQKFIFRKEQFESFEAELRSIIETIERSSREGIGALPRQSPHCPECGFFRGGHCLLFPPGV